MSEENQAATTFCMDVRRCVPAEQTLCFFNCFSFSVRSPGNMKSPLKQKSRNNDLGNECAAQSWDKYPEIRHEALRLQLQLEKRKRKKRQARCQV